MCPMTSAVIDVLHSLRRVLSRAHALLVAPTLLYSSAANKCTQHVMRVTVHQQVAALGVVHSGDKPSAQTLYEWRALHRPKLQRRVLLQTGECLAAYEQIHYQRHMQLNTARTASHRSACFAESKYRTIGLGPLAVHWATDSLVWLVSITLLLAILSATLCLCRMQFSNDTLLFAHAKVD